MLTAILIGLGVSLPDGQPLAHSSSLDHILSRESREQPTVAQSSCEAEYIGANQTGVVMLGVYNMCCELGWVINSMIIQMDATAAIGVSLRAGIGKFRHLEVCYLWLQQKVKDKVFQIVKVEGTKNSANVLTKHVNPRELHEQLIGHLDIKFEIGRAESAL